MATDSSPMTTEQSDGKLDPHPMPIESLKVLVDYAKWLATVCTAIIAASGSLVGGKIGGVWLWVYVLSLCALTWCVAAAGTVILSLSHLIFAFEQGVADATHAASAKLLHNRLNWQWKLFSIGLLLFAATIVSTTWYEPPPKSVQRDAMVSKPARAAPIGNVKPGAVLG